jgi:hypothetical protein
MSVLTHLVHTCANRIPNIVVFTAFQSSCIPLLPTSCHHVAKWSTARRGHYRQTIWCFHETYCIDSSRLELLCNLTIGRLSIPASLPKPYRNSPNTEQCRLRQSRNCPQPHYLGRHVVGNQVTWNYLSTLDQLIDLLYSLIVSTRYYESGSRKFFVNARCPIPSKITDMSVIALIIWPR